MTAVSCGLQRDGAPQRDDGIEHGTGGVGKRRDRLQRGGVGQGAAAADESGAVGFAGDFALLAALAHHQMQQPRRLFLLRSGRGGCREWRRRRAANSVCTNRLLKAGCAASAAGGASTTSA